MCCWQARRGAALVQCAAARALAPSRRTWNRRPVNTKMMPTAATRHSLVDDPYHLDIRGAGGDFNVPKACHRHVWSNSK